MNKVLILLSIIMVSGSTFANEYPTFDINGVEHYLVNEDEASGQEWWSEDGYCVENGFEWAANSFSQLIGDVEPLVAMDDQGNIRRVFKKNTGNLWVITSVTCE